MGPFSCLRKKLRTLNFGKATSNKQFKKSRTFQKQNENLSLLRGGVKDFLSSGSCESSQDVGSPKWTILPIFGLATANRGETALTIRNVWTVKTVSF